MISKLTDIKAIQLFQLFRFLAVLGVGVILSKFQFSQAEIGKYETFLFLQYSFTFFWLSGIINTFLAQAAKQEDRAVIVFNTALLLLIFSVVSISAIVFLHVVNLIHTDYLWLLLVYVLLSIPAYLNEYILLLYQENKKLIVYGVVILLIPLIFSLLAIFILKSIQYVIISLLFVAIIKLLYLFYLLAHYASFKINIGYQKQMLVKSLPLSLSYLLSGSSEVIDGYLVKKYFSDQFAMYRYGARELPLVLLLANAFSTAVIAKISAGLDEGLAIIKQQANQLFSYLFPVTVFLMFSSKYIFTYVFNIDFAESAVIFNVYLLLIVSRLLFPQAILNGLQKNNFLVVSAFLETLINITASLFFIQQYGIVGIAMGTVVANLFDKLLLIFYVSFKLKINPNSYINISQHLFYTGLLYIIFYLLHYEYLL